jgi:hypothetical protein
MHRARVHDEVRTGPGESTEEFGGQEIAFEAIASRASEHDVAGHVCASARQRMNVIQRRKIEFKRRRAVDAAAAAVAHGRALDRSFLMSGGNRLGPAVRPRQAWEGAAVKMPTS